MEINRLELLRLLVKLLDKIIRTRGRFFHYFFTSEFSFN